LCADVENIVPSDESITVLVFELSIHILFCLLKGYVEVAVQAGQDTCENCFKSIQFPRKKVLAIILQWNFTKKISFYENRCEM
jgi:hypothetical protein